MGERGQFLFAKTIGTSPIIVVQAKNNLSVFFIITFRNVTHFEHSHLIPVKHPWKSLFLFCATTHTHHLTYDVPKKDT